MKIRYFSDLHLEFIQTHKLKRLILDNILPIEGEEICILAGDIGYPDSENYDIFMKFISKHFIKTFVILGNHEYYQKGKNVKNMVEENDVLKLVVMLVLEVVMINVSNMAVVNDVLYLIVVRVSVEKLINVHYMVVKKNNVLNISIRLVLLINVYQIVVENNVLNLIVVRVSVEKLINV